MNIAETGWVSRNAHMLTPEERKPLDDVDFFNQYANGQLHMPVDKLLKILEHCEKLYSKYVLKGGAQG